MKRFHFTTRPSHSPMRYKFPYTWFGVFGIENNKLLNTMIPVPVKSSELNRQAPLTGAGSFFPLLRCPCGYRLSRAEAACSR